MSTLNPADKANDRPVNRLRLFFLNRMTALGDDYQFRIGQIFFSTYRLNECG
jgi:hypothetical protein